MIETLKSYPVIEEPTKQQTEEFISNLKSKNLSLELKLACLETHYDSLKRFLEFSGVDTDAIVSGSHRMEH